jgi:uncharacterized protein YndB with AHSA1/START domain
VIVAHGETEIAAPIERVFEYLADARTEPAWLPGATSVEKVTDGPVGKGTRFEGVYARAGRVSVELVDSSRHASYVSRRVEDRPLRRWRLRSRRAEA